MSNIGKNIKKIRNVRKISQAEFAKLFDLARPSIGAYEEGRSEPKIDTIIQIADYFRVSIDVLLNKSLSVADILSFGDLNQKLNDAHEKLNISKHEEVEQTGIPFIEIKNFLDYTINYKSSIFLDALPRVDIPTNYKGETRAFEMQGSEMEYHQQGLHHGDLLVCQRVEPTTELCENMVYIFVLKDSLLIRRLGVKIKDHLTLTADDPNYEKVEIDRSESMETWMVKAVFSQYLNGPKLLDEKVLGMEKRLAILERIVRKMM